MLWLDQDVKTLYETLIFRTTQKMTIVMKVTKSHPLSNILTRVLVILFQMIIFKALTSHIMSKYDIICQKQVSQMGFQVLVLLCYTSINLICSWVKKKCRRKSRIRFCFENNWIPSKHSLHSFFDNSFNSPSRMAKLYERDLYGIDNARKDRRGMLEMPVNRKMKRGNFEYLYFKTVACVSGWTDFR